MQITMKKRWQNWAIGALIALVSAASARLLSNTRFFQLLNLKALDAHFVLRGKMPPSNIVLIVADQKALDTFPELRMFWHPYYADAIRAAGGAGAKVIGLDVVFGVPVTKWEPDYDRLVGEAVSTSPVPVVCGYVSSFAGNQEAQAVPINILSAALGLSGFSNLTSDADDFVRSQELIEAPSQTSNDAPLSRSFALRIAEKYLGVDAAFQNGRLTLAGKSIPISPDRSVIITEASPPDSVPRVSLADVVAAERGKNLAQLRAWFQDRIVLIGSDSVEDRYATPFYTMFSGPKWTTAGVEIQANAVRTLLDGKYLRPVPEWLHGLALIFVTALGAVIIGSCSAGPAAAWLGVEFIGIFVITDLLFRAGLVLSTSETLSATLFCVVLSITYSLSTAEKRGNLFRQAVSLFVGRQLAESLDETAAIQLSGKRADVTIVFTDIRGFTAFTEQTCEDQGGPEIVVELLNEYLKSMVSIIVKYHGHVNKFIGDGILAVFSDADEGAAPGDHAARAVACATEIVTAPSRFQTGAGLHTGLVVLGNVGSADKMEYTVLGDTVNLASRLESLNKEHKTRLLMSEATRSRLGDTVETLHLGAIPVRGKAVPVNLYTVASLMPASKALVNA